MTALSTHGVSVGHHPLLQQAITAIAAALQPEKIICFGMRRQEQVHWSCFTTSVPCITTTCSYDLLIISTDADKSKREAMAHTIQQHYEKDIILSAQVHSRAAVVEAVQQSHPFFCRILTEGEVLYDKGTTSFPCSATCTKQILIDQDAVKGMQRAEEFMLAATHTVAVGKPQVSIFLLHQAMEQATCALIKKYMGYLPATHRLGRLLALVENCTPQLLPFHHTTDAERQRFTLLEQAYIGARYHNHYTVTHEDIIILHEQVREYITQAAHLFHQ